MPANSPDMSGAFEASAIPQTQWQRHEKHDEPRQEISGGSFRDAIHSPVSCAPGGETAMEIAQLFRANRRNVAVKRRLTRS